MSLSSTLIQHGLTPSSFQDMETYKQHTSKRFLESFGRFIDKVADFGQAGSLDQTHKARLREIAQSVVGTRGRGIEAWTVLQAYRQCLKERETPAHLNLITELASAYYAKFAAYETLDDLPAFDNDATRRNAPSIWKLYGEETAILFATVLSSFATHTVLNLPLDQALKFQILEEVGFTDIQTLVGMSIHLAAEDVASSEAISITLQSHALKVSTFTACAMAAAALVAHAPEEATTMRKLGYVTAACGQIVNDADYGAVDHDRETNAPNIVATAGWEGAREIFRQYKAQAQQILAGYTHPNKHLLKFLIELERLFTQRAASSN